MAYYTYNIVIFITAIMIYGNPITADHYKFFHHEYQSWLYIAEKDLQSAQILIQQLLYEQGIYFAHQATEKSLKAFIAAHNNMPTKTHNLDELLSECITIDQSLTSLTNAIAILQPYGSHYRYPYKNRLPTIEQQEAHAVITHVKNIITLIKKKLTNK